MKKNIIILALSLVFSQFSMAQNNQNDLTQDLQEFSQEMNKAMKEMQELLGHSSFFVDTLLLKGLEPLTHQQSPLWNTPTDSLDFNGMIDLMQEQLNQLSTKDWEEINKMMEQFGHLMPMPDGQNGFSPKEQPRRNKNGRKIYSM